MTDSKKYKIVIICLVVVLLLVVVLGSLFAFNRPKTFGSLISINDIETITCTNYISSEYNKVYKYELTQDEITQFVNIAKATYIEKDYSNEEYDGFGLSVSIKYKDGTTNDFYYLKTLRYDDKRYEVYGYCIDYIYTTSSYLDAKTTAESE